MANGNESFEDDVELASAKQVDSYTRRTETGKVVTVRGYVRTDNSAVADRARQAPGRPTVAANSGTFPAGRTIPVWPDAGKGGADVASKEAPVEYEGMEETGEVDQAALDKEVPIALEVMANLPQNPALRKLTGILQGLSTVNLSEVGDPYFDPDVIELARGIVKISGYSYVSKKTGKVVRVNPYSQLRSLINAMGGPSMAAKKGVTPDLLDKALPGFEVKSKLYKAKDTGKGSRAKSAAGRISNANAMREINNLPIDRTIDIPEPKPGDNTLRKAMSTQHPLEAVRVSREGSVVTRGNDTWVRSMDGLWYKTPRRNNKGVDDKSLTKSLTSKGGQVNLTQGNPPTRREYPLSSVDYDSLNPDSVNYNASVRYAKSLEPTFRNLPEGIADSINGNLDVRRPSTGPDKRTSGMTRTSATKANNYYPKLVVNPDPATEADVIKSVPKQQREGYTVPTTLHPMETVMARESSAFIETLMKNRAPADMVDRMYDNLSAAYDKHVKGDDGDFTGLTGRDAWDARMTGNRSEALRTELTEGLSLSALGSPEDFLAEAWTEYVGHPSPRPMARAMGEAYQKSMEEFSDYLFKNKWVDASEIPESTFNKTTKKDISRKVSDIVEGAEDKTTTTNLVPRDLRSVLINSSKYIDIRDANGNPTFDAEVYREGDTAHIGTLSYPLSDPDGMPTGIPEGLTIINMEEGARYYSTPLEDLAQGPSNQKKYSDFIDQAKALRAIEAVEETMFSEGVRRFEADPRPGEDSILYARAGYQWDPQAMDVHEVSNMLNDVEELMDHLRLDSHGYEVGPTEDNPNPTPSPGGFWTLGADTQRKIKSQVTKWQKRMTADPATWPSPQDIAKLGKERMDENSIGEEVLNRYAWNGVKNLKGEDYPKWYPEDDAIDDSLSGYEYDFTKDLADDQARWAEVAPPVSATAINSVSRAVSGGDSGGRKPPKTPTPTGGGAEEPNRDKDTPNIDPVHEKQLKESMTNLASEVTNRHKENFPDAKVTYTGKGPKHSLIVKDNKGKQVLRIGISSSEDGSVEWTGPTYPKDNLAAAFLSFDMVDHLESAYQNSNVSRIVKNTKKGDPIGGYVMASTGYTWTKPPTREALGKALHSEVAVQVANMRQDLEAAASNRHRSGSTEDLFRAQREVDRTVEGLQNSLTSQVNAYLEKFDSDPDGPTPFEIAQIGKKEAYQVSRVRRQSPGGQSRARTMEMPEDPGENATPAQKAEYRRKLESLERAEERARARQGTLLQQMTSIDGDAINDSFTEFIGKQALTLGAYGWYKSMGGYWNWATDSYNPSARKASVGLLFMLLRLLPASLMRGGLMQVTNQLTKKIRSPRPEDWPSPQEIARVIEQLENKVSSAELAKLKETDNG